MSLQIAGLMNALGMGMMRLGWSESGVGDLGFRRSRGLGTRRCRITTAIEPGVWEPEGLRGQQSFGLKEAEAMLLVPKQSESKSSQAV